MRTTALAAAAALAALAAPALAQTAPEGEGTTLQGALIDRDGAEVGLAILQSTASGYVLLSVEGSGFDAGPHGVHLHEVGACDAPEFTSAEGHVAGDMDHGVQNPGGPHPGDFANAFVQQDGVLAAEYFTDRFTLEDGGLIQDEDGTALMIHSGADDYETETGGDSGDRVACAVLEPSS